MQAAATAVAALALPALPCVLAAAAADGALRQRAAPTFPFGYGCTTPAQRALAPVFCNASEPNASARVADLVGRLTVAEKVNLTWISGCTDKDPTDGGAARLGLPGYAWGVEILHGAQSQCVEHSCPTIFPVLASLASSFNRTLWHLTGDTISTEMRALNNLHVGRNDCPQSMIGVNGWGPNVNLVRDPRWGRNIEVPSEDPLLAGAVGVGMLRGLQFGLRSEHAPLPAAVVAGDSSGSDGNNNNLNNNSYIKLLASIKHFSVYSMESSDGQSRFGFDPNVSLRDMGESYLPAFRAAVVDGAAQGMMCSYTSVNGTAFCESQRWIKGWARGKHNFQGNVVTDCGALNMPGPEARMDTAHNAAAALLAGTDLNCGQPWAYDHLGDALDQALVTEKQLDATVARSLLLRMRAGMFDPVVAQPYTRLGVTDLGSAAHRELAYEAATQGLVLLQNPRGAVAPLDAAAQGTAVAVIGPHATSTRGLLGSYFDSACPGPKDTWDCVQTPAQAVEALVRGAGGGGTVAVHPGCLDVACVVADVAAAAEAAAAADQVVLLLGIDQDVEGEGHDRANTTLPGRQLELAQAVVAAGRPTVVVLVNGGIVSVDFLLAQPHVAVVEAWYPGIEGARAIADAVFGRVNRFGKLPVTVHRASFATQAQPVVDMSMTAGVGRTYKFWTGDDPLYTFGSGLSYSTFALSGDALPAGPVVFSSPNATVTVTVGVRNTHTSRVGDEVVQLYHRPTQQPGGYPFPDAPQPLPSQRLLDFQRAADLVPGGATRPLRFTVTAADLGLVDNNGDTVLYPGHHQLVLTRTGGAAAAAEGDDVALNVSVELPRPAIIETLL